MAYENRAYVITYAYFKPFPCHLYCDVALDGLGACTKSQPTPSDLALLAQFATTAECNRHGCGRRIQEVRTNSDD